MSLPPVRAGAECVAGPGLLRRKQDDQQRIGLRAEVKPLAARQGRDQEEGGEVRRGYENEHAQAARHGICAHPPPPQPMSPALRGQLDGKGSTAAAPRADGVRY